MTKTYKKLIALCAVLFFVFTLIPSTAFAQDPFSTIAIGGLTGTAAPGLFGSMAAASGINIGYSSTDEMSALWDVTNSDHVYFSGEKHEATNIDEDIYDYIEVDLNDWLDAQSDFIAKFVNDNQVDDNDSGTLSTPYTWRGLKLNDTTPTYTGYGVHNWTYGVIIECYQSGSPSNPYGYRLKIDGVTKQEVFNSRAVNYRAYVYTAPNAGNFYLRFVVDSTNYNILIGSSDSGRTQSFNTSWISDTVDTSVFDDYGTAKVKVPNAISGLTTGWGVPDFMTVLNTLWENGQESNIIIEDGENPPIPPQPIPSTPLGEVPYDEWMDTYGQHVIDNQEEIGQVVNDIPGLINDTNETLENIDQNVEDSTESLESIDTNIGVGNGILGGIRSLVSGISEILSDIKDAVSELVQEVVLATETFIAGLLNTIPIAFSGWFQTMKQSFSIWHYVVEWFNSISGVFGWFWTVASGTSYYIVLPIYASLAGAVVLAFYKRFGK